jgi:hypothetical protein
LTPLVGACLPPPPRNSAASTPLLGAREPPPPWMLVASRSNGISSPSAADRIAPGISARHAGLRSPAASIS